MANQPKKYKKFVATAATATLVASAIVPVASAAGFTDVAGNDHEVAINALADAGIINGYADGSFKPNQTINRGQVVKLLGRYLEAQGQEIPADWNTKQRFNDLPTSAEAELVKYAALAKDAGVFNGSNGNLNHTQTMQRQQMAVVLVRAIKEIAGVDLVAEYKKAGFVTEISDLEKAYSAEQRNAIVALEYAGITNVSNFNPGNSVTRGQFASFLYRTIENVINAPVAGVKEIKAVNNTTVEVTFDEEVDNVQALHFLISDLEVKSAAVKQTNKKVVVLTTAAQTADKEYTVSLGEDKIGTFKGIAAVVPTAIKLTTPSVQGTIGKEVTLKAEVTVPEGQSKEGIPVTFNIANSTNNQLNEKIEKVAYTNADGVATYSYTRYYKHNDNVTAYSTDRSSVYASGKVYWAEGLSITEVTTGNELANGSKKVYKIKTDAYNTQYVGNSTTVDYNYVNVAFAENVDVSPDKLVRDVKVIDTGVSGNSDYPSQVTTGGVNVVKVKVNSNGEATFTLTGSNASVTPIVFVDESTNKVGKYTKTALQASAPTVKFALNHTLGLTVKAEGVQNAAAKNTGNFNNKGTGDGGREYTVTVTDKDGKVAPAGTKAYVTFADGSYSTDKAVTIFSADGKRNAAVNKNTRFEIEVTGSKGEAKFKLEGVRDAFAAPTVYLENGKEVGLDKADLQTVGETTYFVDAVIANATLTAVNSNGKEVTTLPTTQTAYFEYQSVDQNGFDYYAGNGVYEVAYQVTAQFADVVANGTTVKAGTTETIKVTSVAGKAVLNVTSTNVASNVSVQASASQVSLPNQTASLAFTKGTQVPDIYTGTVSSIDTINNKLTFAGYDAITYSTSSFKNQQGVVIDEAKFEKEISDALAAKKPVTVTSTKNTDGTYTLEIEKIGDAPVAGTGTITGAVLSVDGKQLTLTFDKNVVASSIDADDFILSAGTAPTVASVNGATVVLNVTGVSAADTVRVDADKLTFTDGTSNGVITVVTIDANPAMSKISKLETTTPNQTEVTKVVAKGSVAVGAKTVNVEANTSESNQADYNGVTVVIKQNGTLTAADPSASYDTIGKVITVELRSVATTDNTLATINAAIHALAPDHGGIKFAKIDLTGDDLAFEDVATPVTVKLDGGATARAAQAGVYTFDIETNLVVGDKVTLNGKPYVAGTDFVVGSTKEVTAANLAAKIKATDARFDTATAVSTNTITLTDAAINNAAAPTLSWN